MRQIQMIVRIISITLFNKDSIEYRIIDTANLSVVDLLYYKLEELLSQLRICEAEDLLFANFEDNNEEFLKLAVSFYQTVNGLSDEELEDNNFSREEIEDGLKEVMRRFDIILPEI